MVPVPVRTGLDTKYYIYELFTNSDATSSCILPKL